jgi:hypothetical protein
MKGCDFFFIFWERKGMKETKYQHYLMNRLKDEFHGCIVLKNDPSAVQGIPDLLVLFEDRWAMLEVKMSHDSPREPNQEYYISELQRMSYAAFIYPEIEEEIFNELQFTFLNRR